ncbi:MAG: PAS domain S-box protein, partial [Verrucomicrobiaceae bacterium]
MITALHASIALVTVLVAVLAVRPHRSWLARCQRGSPERSMARRLLPTALLGSLAIGFLGEFDTQPELLDQHSKAFLLVAFSALMSGLLIRQSIHALAKLETSRQKTEATFLRREEHLEMALEAARIGTWERDLRSNKIRCSETLHEIFGLECEAFDGRFESLVQVIHPEDRSMVQARLARVLEGAEESYRIEYRICCHDGSIRWVAVRGDVLRDSDGVAARIAGVAVDVTERKLLERELIEISNREQRRLGQDLHDDLGQWLTGIHLAARGLVMKLEASASSAAADA